ncbi:UNVERIFIED_CONTAM: hypothetical protein PYX00_001698 [Menopon gallinae]|uniref:DDB1- and CUL4-associated factor 11 n=1 Tax=Menopon gallinae TaxID=328185 RepID=A0AAW2IFG1_9NEOP
MGTTKSRRMDDSDSSSFSDDTFPESDYDSVLQHYIRCGHVRIRSSEDPVHGMGIVMELDALSVRLGKPNTNVLDESEVSMITRQSSGLMHKRGQQRPNSIAAMICARERGLNGSISFSNGDCCKISNSFLPNTNFWVRSFHTKIFCGTYLNDGNIFLSASQDRLVRLFDTRNGNFKLIKTITARDVGWSILDVAVSPDGNYMAYSSWCECLQLCKLWGDTEDQEALLLCPEEKRFCIFSLKFSADGREILCGANDGYIYVYDRECNQRAFRITGHDDDVNAVAFADNRSQILYSAGDDGVCKVWDRRTLSESHPKPVGCLAGHMDGITFIEPRGDGRHLLTNSKDQSIKLWDMRRFSTKIGLQNTKDAVSIQNWDYRWQKVPKGLRNPKKQLEGDTSIMTYCGHSVLQTLCRCHFSPAETTGQRYIYTGCAAGRVIIYDVLTGQTVRMLEGHTNCVRDVAWHPHRPEITSISWDGTIRLWNYHEDIELSDEEEEEGNSYFVDNTTLPGKVQESP